MKAFVDRLSYWTHLMTLAGKQGAVIASASSNGAHHVSNYLEKISHYFGIQVVEKIDIMSVKKYTSEQCLNIAKNIYNHLKGDFPYQTTNDMETIFQTMKFVMSNHDDGHAEKTYWEKNGLFDFDTLQEYTDQKVLQKN